MEAAQADSRPDCRQEQPQAKPEPPQQQSLSYFLFPPLLVMGCGWQQGQHKRGYVLEKRGGRFRVELQLPTVLRCMPDLASLAVAGHPTRILSACMLLRHSLHGPLQQQRGQAHSMRAASGSLPVGHHRMLWPYRCAGPHRHMYKVNLTGLGLSELLICSLATLHHLHTWQCLRPHHEVNAATWPVMSQHMGGTTASKVLRSGQLLRFLHTLPSDESTGQHACRCWQGTRAPAQSFAQERAAAERVVQLYRQAGGVALDVPAEEGIFPKAVYKGAGAPHDVLVSASQDKDKGILAGHAAGARLQI